jgi:hypothetical protein
MPLTARRFGAHEALPAAATTLYTVPAATTAIVKNVIISNKTATAATITASVSGITILGGVSVDANSTITLDLSTVIQTGEVVAAAGGTAGALSVYVSGVEITA